MEGVPDHESVMLMSQVCNFPDFFSAPIRPGDIVDGDYAGLVIYRFLPFLQRNYSLGILVQKTDLSGPSMLLLQVPEIDVGGKVEIADYNVTASLVLQAAGQAC